MTEVVAIEMFRRYPRAGGQGRANVIAKYLLEGAPDLEIEFATTATCRHEDAHGRETALAATYPLAGAPDHDHEIATTATRHPAGARDHETATSIICLLAGDLGLTLGIATTAMCHLVGARAMGDRHCHHQISVAVRDHHLWAMVTVLGEIVVVVDLTVAVVVVVVVVAMGAGATEAARAAGAIGAKGMTEVVSAMAGVTEPLLLLE